MRFNRVELGRGFYIGVSDHCEGVRFLVYYSLMYATPTIRGVRTHYRIRMLKSGTLNQSVAIEKQLCELAESLPADEDAIKMWRELDGR